MNKREAGYSSLGVWSSPGIAHESRVEKQIAVPVIPELIDITPQIPFNDFMKSIENKTKFEIKQSSSFPKLPASQTWSSELVCRRPRNGSMLHNNSSNLTMYPLTISKSFG